MPRTAPEVRAMKGSARIAALTAYDYVMARICEEAGADVVLVGDSAGMVAMGHPDTSRVTVGQMCVFTEAVANARGGALVVADMPFMSYQPGAADAVRNAGRLARAGAGAVKLEGGAEAAPMARAIAAAGIPVMGHIGVQPQTAPLRGGYREAGRDAAGAARLAEGARALEEAGAFAVVLEMVEPGAARAITESASVPTIGIGSGPHCDGQVLVTHDVLGLYGRVRPRFARRYAELAAEGAAAARRYCEDVRSGAFPGGGG